MNEKIFMRVSNVALQRFLLYFFIPLSVGIGDHHNHLYLYIAKESFSKYICILYNSMYVIYKQRKSFHSK